MAKRKGRESADVYKAIADKERAKKKLIQSLLQFLYDDCEMQVASLNKDGDTSWDVSDVHNWEAMSTHLSKIAETLDIKLRD